MRQTRDRKRNAALDSLRGGGEGGRAGPAYAATGDYDENDDAAISACTSPSSSNQPSPALNGSYGEANACMFAPQTNNNNPAYFGTFNSPSSSHYDARYGVETARPQTGARREEDEEDTAAMRQAVLSSVCYDYGFELSDEETLNFLLSIEAELRAEELFAQHNHSCDLDDPEQEYMYYMGQQ